MTVHIIKLLFFEFLFLCLPTRWFFGIFFFFNDPAPTEISPLSLPDALPISRLAPRSGAGVPAPRVRGRAAAPPIGRGAVGAQRRIPGAFSSRDAGRTRSAR